MGGTAIGMASMLAPMYIAEIAPPSTRGLLVTFQQIAIVVGINLVYFVNYFVQSIGSHQFLLDTGAEVTTPGVDAPSSRFASVAEPIALALAQEQRVSAQINALAATAREAGDYSSEQFMQWFIKEQVEEVATMGGLLRVAERAGENAAAIEEYLAREHPGDEGGDPTAPQAAGSA